MPEVVKLLTRFFQNYQQVASSVGSKKSKEIFDSALRDLSNVEQGWRRCELFGKITKILKVISDSKQKEIMFEEILNLCLKEKGEHTKDFFVNHSKNYPDQSLETLLYTTIKLSQYQFESSKAIIRIWIKRRPAEQLISILSNVKGDLRSRLLGYLHFQLNKVRIKNQM